MQAVMKLEDVSCCCCFVGGNRKHLLQIDAAFFFFLVFFQPSLFYPLLLSPTFFSSSFSRSFFASACRWLRKIIVLVERSASMLPRCCYTHDVKESNQWMAWRTITELPTWLSNMIEVHRFVNSEKCADGLVFLYL